MYRKNMPRTEVNEMTFESEAEKNAYLILGELRSSLIEIGKRMDRYEGRMNDTIDDIVDKVTDIQTKTSLRDGERIGAGSVFRWTIAVSGIAATLTAGMWHLVALRL